MRDTEDIVKDLRGGVYGVNRITLCKEAADLIEHLSRKLIDSENQVLCLESINNELLSDLNNATCTCGY